MRIQKWFAALLALVLVFLCGCGRKTPEEPATETASNVVKVMFPEGKTVLGIAKLLEENGVCAADDFIDAVQHSDSTLAQSIDGEDRPFLLEGYVFPATYEFYKNESASSALQRFLRAFEDRWTEEYSERAEELGYTMDEIMTIASIVQKEAGIVSEMPNVAAVLHNRLKKGMMLQCDVTYFYLRDTVVPYHSGGEWSDDVYNRYADRYYTYRFAGLPEGPICNPGLDAIKAALYPADSSALYFFTYGDDFYYFDTYAEHQAKYDALNR